MQVSFAQEALISTTTSAVAPIPRNKIGSRAVKDKTRYSKKKTTSSKTTSTIVKDSDEDEDKYDQNLVKIQLNLLDDGNFYGANFTVGGEELGLKLDIIQPEIWVMNSRSIFGCGYIDEWWSSADQKYGSSAPPQETTAREYRASICAEEGEYSVGTNVPSPVKDNIYNGQPYYIPYMDLISASGTFSTNNISFDTPKNQEITLKDFSFVNVDKTNVYVGGLGLAGNPTGSGFLDSLVSSNIIKSAGYSLWFNNYTTTSEGTGELILGAVDKKYYSGDFFVFDIPTRESFQIPDDLQELLDNLQLPILPLDDIKIENQDNHRTLSLKSDEDIPVLLDSRSLFSYLPLPMIVNLAIQTNASFSSEVNRWIVECDQLLDINATLNFIFGDLSINIPIGDFLSNATYYTNRLKFADGKKACYLNFLPNSVSGYNSLGVSFMRSIYLAVDNEGGKIALANTNSNLHIKRSDLSSSIKHQDYSTSQSSDSFSTINGSIAYIESGHIPFATTHNNTDDFTFTYSSQNATGYTQPSIPVGLSGVTIKSGEVFITQGGRIASNIGSGMGNLNTKSTSSKSTGNRIQPSSAFKNFFKEFMALSIGVVTCIIGIIIL